MGHPALALLGIHLAAGIHLQAVNRRLGTLSNFGVPRSRIERIKLAAPDRFRAASCYAFLQLHRHLRWGLQI